MTNPDLLLPLAIASDARGIGSGIGMALPSLTLAFGVYRCAVIARRNPRRPPG